MFSVSKIMQGSMLISSTLAVHQGALKVQVEGEETELHVVAAFPSDGEHFVTDGAEFKMQWHGELRGFLGTQKMDTMPLSNFHNFTLFDKEVSYDIDLSKVGCSCNAALFFVTMPGFNEDGTVATGNDPHLPFYCDANDIGGVFCWEHDTIEGNMYNMAVTPHTCNALPGQYIPQCDKVGCAKNIYALDPKAFCPDAGCKINTLKPFHIAQRYESDPTGTTLAGIITTLSQGNHSVEWGSCDDTDYLQSMTEPFKGNWTMVFQLWGDSWANMKWLDNRTGCQGDCIVGETETSFSNIAIRSLGSKAGKGEVIVI